MKVVNTTELRTQWQELTVAIADETEAYILWTRGDKVYKIVEATPDEASTARVEFKKSAKRHR